MDIEQIQLPKEKAEEEYRALKKALKEGRAARTAQVYTDYQRVYGHLRHGKAIIDVYEAFKKVGLNEKGNPRLAICRADSKRVLCRQSRNGSVIYFHDNGGKRPPFNSWEFWSRITGDKDDISLPRNTFTWPLEKKFPHTTEELEAVVPVVPASLLVEEVKVLLRNFHIIWEVEKWSPVVPRDPILVKRLTPNMFGVLATWDLTELERSIIRGRIET